MTRPFDAIPGHAADVLRPVLPGLADEIIATIAREVPDYQRAMEGLFGQMVRLGVEVALGRFVDDIEGRPRAEGPEQETYVNLGRGEFHAGRSLDTLLAAYRVGARLAWRRFVDAGVAAGLEPRAIYSIGEGIFEYIDVLSADSAEGYALEQRAEAGERRRRRRRLVRLLAQEPPAPEEEVRAAALDAGWDLPRELAALVVAVPDDDPSDAAERVARELGGGAVAAALGGAACAIVPDPLAPGARRRMEAVVGELPAAIGPAVAPSAAHRSVRRAQATLRLATPGAGLLEADAHLATLLLTCDPGLAADLAQRELRPLAGLPESTAGRLTETLRAWLDRPGQVQAIAAGLGVHPQTVRYRVRQLRELFGDVLEDPESRFALALALRAAEAGPRRMEV